MNDINSLSTDYHMQNFTLGDRRFFIDSFDRVEFDLVELLDDTLNLGTFTAHTDRELQEKVLEILKDA